MADDLNKGRFNIPIGSQGSHNKIQNYAVLVLIYIEEINIFILECGKYYEGNAMLSSPGNMFMTQLYVSVCITATAPDDTWQLSPSY